MAIRPQNRCRDCGYTWYPRGHNVALECRNCHSRAVEVVSVSPVLLLIGLVGFVVVLGVMIGTERPIRQKMERVEAPPPPLDPLPTPVTKKSVPRPVVSPKPAEPDPINHTPVVLKPAPKVPEPVPSAPAPRAIDHSIPPSDAVYATEWERIGAIETRVTGVKIGHAPLEDRAGNWYYSPDPVLRIWVETRAVAPANKEVRRWASTLNPATLSANRQPIAKSKFTGVRGELFGSVHLVPGGRAISDVILFDVPDSKTGDLILAMDADHVGESGRFRHLIPASTWKKQ